MFPEKSIDKPAGFGILVNVPHGAGTASWFFHNLEIFEVSKFNHIWSNIMPKKKADFETQTIEFTFGDAGSETVALSDLPENIVANLAVHGLSQKLGDSYAGAKSATEGTDIDPDVWAKSQVFSVFDQLKAGNWSTRIAGQGGTATDLAKALSEVGKIELETAMEKLADATKEEKAALRKVPEIKAILEALRAERAAAKAKAAQEAAAGSEGVDLSEYLS